MQYTGHDAKVRSVMALPASELVVSRDQGGALHVWSTRTGACAVAFASPKAAVATAAATAAAAARWNLVPGRDVGWGPVSPVGWHCLAAPQGTPAPALGATGSAGAAEPASQPLKDAVKPLAVASGKCALNRCPEQALSPGRERHVIVMLPPPVGCSNLCMPA